MAPTVCVSILLHDSAMDIEGCLGALAAQSRSPDEVVILDNASADDGPARARAAYPGARFLTSEVNLGFSKGHNRAIAFAPADIHVVLSPDVRLQRDFIARSLEPLARDPRIGSVAARLIQFRPDDQLGTLDDQEKVELPDDTLDSTGILAHQDRHFTERGAGEPAQGRYVVPDQVFGPSGAAAVYRRQMLEDVAYNGEVFDETFVSYLDDVDLAWRGQLLGWSCEYSPRVVARHRRTFAPGRCEILASPASHYVGRNEWRMFLKNEIADGWTSEPWHPGSTRDADLPELYRRIQSSIVDLGRLAGSVPGLWARRNDIMRRRVASDEDMMRWFGPPPSSPIDAVIEAGQASGRP